MTEEERIFALRSLPGAPEYLAAARELAGAIPFGARDPDTLGRVGVLGAGAMGRGIAMAFVQTGRHVVLVDPSTDALAAARNHLGALAERQCRKGLLDGKGRDALLARITFAESLDAFDKCDLVVEAVPEVLTLKQQVISQIEDRVASETLIATNTSTLDIDAIAGALSDPARFIGTHFFMPAQVNRLLEVIPAAATSTETLASVMALAKALGKDAAIAANGDGFIGNRLFDRFHQEAMYLVEEGAWPDDVDDALEAWGMAIGPFRALDLVGNDIPWGVRKQRAQRARPPAQPRIGDALCEAGLHGQKVGRGWYFYDAATPKGRFYEEVRALILRESRALGVTRRAIGAPEIVGRCIAALIIEGMALLREGRASRASDVDMVYVTGYGFPAATGGPMQLGEALGETEVLALANHYASLSERSAKAWALPEALTKGAAE